METTDILKSVTDEDKINILNKTIENLNPTSSGYSAMCSSITNAIIDYFYIYGSVENRIITGVRVKRMFPEFNRNNFIKFIEINYSSYFNYVKFLHDYAHPYWIFTNNEGSKIRIEFIKHIKEQYESKILET